MAPSLSSTVVLALYVILSRCVSGDDCLCYTEWSPWFHFRIALSSFWSCQKCFTQFCCGDCYNRYCCSDPFRRFDKDQQEQCLNTVRTLSLPTAITAVSIFLVLISLVIVTCCCVFPSCCLYKRFRQPCYLITTTTHAPAVPTIPQQYPQQPILVPGPSKSYQGMPNQSVPTQPGYSAQAMPMSQPFTPGPPPSYQEAIGSAYRPQPMPYS